MRSRRRLELDRTRSGRRGSGWSQGKPLRRLRERSRTGGRRCIGAITPMIAIVGLKSQTCSTRRWTFHLYNYADGVDCSCAGVCGCVWVDYAPRLHPTLTGRPRNGGVASASLRLDGHHARRPKGGPTPARYSIRSDPEPQPSALCMSYARLAPLTRERLARVARA